MLNFESEILKIKINELNIELLHYNESFKNLIITNKKLIVKNSSSIHI